MSTTPRRRADDLNRPHVQVSLDLTSIDAALHVAEIAVAAGVDWLEAGTPLILAEGLHGCTASAPCARAFPTFPLWPTSRRWMAATSKSR